MSENKVEEKVEESKEGQLVSLLKDHSNAPTAETIEQWKQEYGEVFVSGFSETELFVWRSVTRPEWIQLQTLASSSTEEVTQFQFEEKVCTTCVLWKSINKPWNEGKAGTPSSLHEQILQNSNFMSPQQASLLVAKL